MIYNELIAKGKGDIMFVSSYNTYINSNASSKNIKGDYSSKNEPSRDFNSKLSDTLSAKPLINTFIPANYISPTKVQYNKQLFDSQQQELKKNVDKEFKKTTETTSKFSTVSTLGKAKVAYAENSIMFSFWRKPQVALDQTPKIQADLPQELQELKEQKMRYVMVNTYLENDKYYQITA